MKSTAMTAIFVVLSAYGQGSMNYKEKPELWFAGPMHSNEVVGKTGETWLALCRTPNGFELISAKVTVRENPKKDDPYNMSVTLDCLYPSIFLVRGIPELKPGPIKTVFYGSTYIEPSQGLTLRLEESNELSYSLSASGVNKGGFVQDYKMKLSSRTKSQIILNRARIYEHIYLLWAGDLDRDGKLDLLMDLHDNYNVQEPTLYLSSKAKRGELVNRYISYRSVGC